VYIWGKIKDMAVFLGGISGINIKDGPFSKGDIYKGMVVASEVGAFSNKEDAKEQAKKDNIFFKETKQKLISKVISYNKKIGDRKVSIIKVVTFYK